MRVNALVCTTVSGCPCGAASGRRSMRGRFLVTSGTYPSEAALLRCIDGGLQLQPPRVKLCRSLLHPAAPASQGQALQKFTAPCRQTKRMVSPGSLQALLYSDVTQNRFCPSPTKRCIRKFECALSKFAARALLMFQLCCKTSLNPLCSPSSSCPASMPQIPIGPAQVRTPIAHFDALSPHTHIIPLRYTG